ncbi:iron-sulfur cluster biosynthesis family protein [Enterococcus asini]|uniref:iron-sulfur cluster biosynthesis family protein n=1 Tax=Enterococcus TaxID=1350 RepID=UPI00288C820A|nr:iron-sulfur cluster biosynthesis family protein [Enterococcus asini]MDT2755942.1 iron-sulfur cluster biosynthesis family protein [Enterococcus asini]
MKLTISDSAATALEKRLNNTTFILALNDGTNQFSTVGGSCAVGDKFQILASQGPKDNYNIPLETPHFHVYISAGEKDFINEDITLDYNDRLSTFSLKTNAGILDNNLLIRP